MARISISGAVRRESTNGPNGSETWECTRSQGRESMSLFLYLNLIESQRFVIYLSR